MALPVSEASVPHHPTLFIGLGEAGIHFIDLVRQRMPAGFEAGAPYLGLRAANLSQYGRAQAPGAPDDANPAVITLRWNAEQARRVAEQTPGFEWYQQCLDDPSARARLDGRMAFLMAVYLQHDDRLENRLNALVQSLEISSANPLMIYIITSVREPESAFLGDLICALYTWIGRTRIRVLMPCLVLNDTRKNAPSRPGWAAVCLRELERFTLRGKQNAVAWPAGLVPPALEIVEGGLFSSLLVIENESYLPLLANQLAALVERDAAVKFSADYCNLPIPDQFSVSTSNSHTFWVPVEELRCACAVRMLREELLESRDEENSTFAKVIEFLRGSSTNSPLGWDAFGWMADVLEGKPRSSSYLVVNARTLPEIFNRRLEQFLNNEHSSSLYPSERFLTNLQNSMEKTLNPVSRMGEGGSALVGQMPGFREVIGGYLQAISEWKVVLTSLDRQLEDRYERMRLQLCAALRNATSGQTVYWLGSNLEDPIEPAYQQLRSQPRENWITLLEKLRESMRWQWVSPQGDQPYLRCLLRNTAHTDAETMIDPLLSVTYPLTSEVAVGVGVFQYLGRLSAQKITSVFEHATSMVAFDPILAVDRRIHQYLIGDEDSMVHTWGLSADITLCKSSGKHRLTYIRLTHNLPIQGLKTYQVDLGNYLDASPYLHVYPHEQNARKVEAQFSNLYPRSPAGKLTASITRLMHDDRLFSTAMWCVYYDWIKRRSNASGISQWQVEIGGIDPICLEIPGRFPANSLEDALTNFIISIPCQDLDGLHPLVSRNLPNTLTLLEKTIHEQRSRPFSTRKEWFPFIQQRIDEWEESKDAFLQGLAVYQQMLLADEKKRRTKS